MRSVSKALVDVVSAVGIAIEGNDAGIGNGEGESVEPVAVFEY